MCVEVFIPVSDADRSGGGKKADNLRGPEILNLNLAFQGVLMWHL